MVGGLFHHGGTNTKTPITSTGKPGVTRYSPLPPQARARGGPQASSGHTDGPGFRGQAAGPATGRVVVPGEDSIGRHAACGFGLPHGAYGIAGEQSATLDGRQTVTVSSQRSRRDCWRRRSRRMATRAGTAAVTVAPARATLAASPSAAGLSSAYSSRWPAKHLTSASVRWINSAPGTEGGRKLRKLPSRRSPAKRSRGAAAYRLPARSFQRAPGLVTVSSGAPRQVTAR